MADNSNWKYALTRRNFLGGVLVGGVVTVMSHLLPPLPHQFSGLGVGTKIAKAVGEVYCTGGICPPGCNCVVEGAMGVGCATLCGSGTCNDFFHRHLVFMHYGSGECCCEYDPYDPCEPVDIIEACDTYLCTGGCYYTQAW